MSRFVWAGLAGGAAALTWAWRHYRWPCPSWLVPLLENPYFETVAGAEKLIARAGVKRGMTVLDAGCGPGRVSLPLAQAVGSEGRVVALDLQEGMLAKLRARSEEQGTDNIELVRGGLGDGVVPQAGFDVAFLITVLGEIPDPIAALEEIRDALRPGGVLSVTEVLPDPHYQRLERVRELAAQVGLEEAQLFDGTIAYTINVRRPVQT